MEFTQTRLPFVPFSNRLPTTVFGVVQTVCIRAEPRAPGRSAGAIVTLCGTLTSVLVRFARFESRTTRRVRVRPATREVSLV